jgi:integrase/recombinase XerC
MSTELAPIFEFPIELASTTEDVIEAWLAGRNAATRRGYLSDLGQFALWAKAPSSHAVIDALLRMAPGHANRVVLGYQAHMVESGLSSSTINRRLAAIRSMVKFGRRIGVITWSLDTPGVKVEARHDMRGPDLADTRLLFRAADHQGDSKSAKRDRAIMALLFDLGLRRAELCGLDLADVEPGQEGLPVAVWIVGKGHREKQRVTVPPATSQLLDAWIGIRGILPGPLFHRCDRKDFDLNVRLTGESVRLITKRLSTMAGVKCVRPHGLRHAAATTLLDEGRRVQDVQKFTRHAKLEMVLRYEDARHDTAGELAGLLSRRRQEERKPRS